MHPPSFILRFSIFSSNFRDLWIVKPSCFRALDTLFTFHEKHIFNSPRKNTIHKSGKNKKKKARRYTQSASRRASGILRSCEMCKSQQNTFSLIFRAVGYRKRRCHPHAQHIIPLIYLRHSVYLSRAAGHFSLASRKE